MSLGESWYKVLQLRAVAGCDWVRGITTSSGLWVLIGSTVQGSCIEVGALGDSNCVTNR